MEEPLNGTNEFWRIMVEGGVLDERLAGEFRRRTHKKWTPLGQILVERRILDISQVMGLLAMQADEPEMRLGDLAVREGMCTSEQISAALVEQRQACPHPIELLLEDRRIEKAGFFTILIDYVRWLEGQLYASRVG